MKPTKAALTATNVLPMEKFKGTREVDPVLPQFCGGATAISPVLQSLKGAERTEQKSVAGSFAKFTISCGFVEAQKISFAPTKNTFFLLL